LVADLGVPQPVVLGMARGGVAVGAEVARLLGAPLDVLVVRKLGYPPQPELAMGAIGEGGVRVLNGDLLAQLAVPDRVVEEVAAAEIVELERRLAAYRPGRQAVEIAGRPIVVVDDGLATGATARAAVAVLRARGAARVVLAVPCAPPQAVRTLRAEADEVVCVEISEHFFGIGQWYDDFSQVDDDEVRRLLDAAAPDALPTTGAGAEAERTDVSEVHVELDALRLPGVLEVPAHATGIVVFAHGSGSSHTSPRHRPVASELHRLGMATLLFDLLTVSEGGDRAKVFDIGLLGSRLVGAIEWAGKRPGLAQLPLGLFGASTGAAAALVASARRGSSVRAVVSRGGRPDLAPEADLRAVTAPVLLIVGSEDTAVLERNRRAVGVLARAKLEVVGGATHLFEEPGALEAVARSAAGFFSAHLR
jgi:predicted phosphoribosyltransferase/dienelactone hydrolase